MKTNTIHRPAYYHPPRSRPVSFEDPNCRTHCQVGGSKFTIYVNRCSGHEHQSGCLGCKMASLNRSPRPFERQTLSESYYHHQPIESLSHQYNSNSINRSITNQQQVEANQHQQQHQHQQNVSPKPRIMVNDQSWPTSTVHKSFLNSKQIQSTTSSNVSHAKIITGNNEENLAPQSDLQNSSWIGQNHHHQHQQQQRENLGYESAMRKQDIKQVSPVETRDTISLSGFSQSPSLSSHEPTIGHLQRPLPTSGGGSVSVADSHSTLNAYQSLPRRSKSVRNARSPSSSVLPDDKRKEFMWNRQLERASIAHQTYRTLPIVLPKPKARHDLATGTYMQYQQDPTWELAKAKPVGAFRNIEDTIQQAINVGVGR